MMSCSFSRYQGGCTRTFCLREDIFCGRNEVIIADSECRHGICFLCTAVDVQIHSMRGRLGGAIGQVVGVSGA
jgi:hypothetical protein